MTTKVSTGVIGDAAVTAQQLAANSVTPDKLNIVFYENSQTVTADYTITAGKNAMSAGPITINTGVTVTVPTGSVWTIV